MVAEEEDVGGEGERQGYWNMGSSLFYFYFFWMKLMECFILK
jgi:hypothetical protein